MARWRQYYFSLNEKIVVTQEFHIELHWHLMSKSHKDTQTFQGSENLPLIQSILNICIFSSDRSDKVRV